jgi:hypothetical protein
MLHRLALRYWSQGRMADALRVEKEAARILPLASPGAPILKDVVSTLEGIERELRATGHDGPPVS